MCVGGGQGKEDAKKSSGKQTATELGKTTRHYEDGEEKLQWFKLQDPEVTAGAGVRVGVGVRVRVGVKVTAMAGHQEG